MTPGGYSKSLLECFSTSSGRGSLFWYVLPARYSMLSVSEVSQMVVRAPTDKELERVKTYGARVRDLDLSGAAKQAQEMVLDLWASWFGDHPLFPQLRKLRGLIVADFALTIAELVPEGCLKNLAMRREPSQRGHHFSTLLSDIDAVGSEGEVTEELISSYKGLDSFSASYVNTAQILGRKSPLWGFAHLATLRLHNDRPLAIDRAMLSAMAKLKQLRTLSITGFEVNKISRAGTFPALHRLELASTAPHAASLVSAIRLAKLESIRLDVDVDSQKDHRHIQTIISSLPTSLVRAQIAIKEAGAHTIVVEDVLSGLRPLPALEHVWIRIAYNASTTKSKPLPDLTDEALSSFVQAWPNLNFFDVALLPRSGYVDPPEPYVRPALDTILAFAHGHTRLTHLGLPYMDETSVLAGGSDTDGSDTEGHEDNAAPHSALRWVSIGEKVPARRTTADSRTARRLANALLRAFPKLQWDIGQDAHSFHTAQIGRAHV